MSFLKIIFQTVVRRLMALPTLLINNNHPGAKKISENIHTQHYLYLTAVNDKDRGLCKQLHQKVHDYDNILIKLLRFGASGVFLMYPNNL